MKRFSLPKMFLFVVVAIVVAPWLARPAMADAPATSKDLCQQKVGGYALPAIIRDSPTAAIRAVTLDDLYKLRRVLNSQCMLSADELARFWNGKEEAERAVFFSNYDRINRAITNEVFNSIFPNRVSVYTRESFIKSAMAFPSLCGEDGETDETCKREFATMFAHWLQETSGLQYLNESGCASGVCSSYLDVNGYFYNAYAPGSYPATDYQYWGRGPKQLSYNGNYGRFSWGYLGKMDFLERPSLLVDENYIDQSFVSAFWFYMTAISQKPSMHEVVTGLWQPNSEDIEAGIVPGFGATIDIINGALECNKPSSAQVTNRINFYKGGLAQGVQTIGTLAAFGLQPKPGEVMNCENFRPFPAGGAGSYPLYFNLNRWSQCELYVNESLFTVYDQTPMKSLGNQVCRNGLDCCRQIQPRLKDLNSDLPPLQLDTFVKWMGGSPLDIKVNGSEGPVTITKSQPFMISLSLDTGGRGHAYGPDCKKSLL